MNTDKVKLLKLISGLVESILGIPILGAVIVISLSYIPLLIMLGLHIWTLLCAKNENCSYAGSIVGIVTSCIAWVPFLGMSLHIATAVILLMDVFNKPQKSV